MRRATRAVLAGGACLAAVMGTQFNGSSLAQRGGCSLTTYTDPPREVLVCPDGLSVTTERGAAFTFRDRNGDGRVDGVQLTSKGILVDVAPGRRGGFQVQTPHAIASVRGTIWAVEVTPERSSVFVQTGTVTVRRPAGRPVTLQDGDGVDVGPGTGPLEVKRWGAERAANFLARFGR